MITDNQRRILAESIEEDIEERVYNALDDGYTSPESHYSASYSYVVETFYDNEGIDLEDTEYETLRELVDFEGISERILAECPQEEMDDYDRWRQY